MSFLFPQKRPKTLNEVVYTLNEWLMRIGELEVSPNIASRPLAPGFSGTSQATSGSSAGPASSDIMLNEQQKQAVEESGRLLAQIRKATWGRPPDSGSQPEPNQLTALAKEVYSTDVLVPLLNNLKLLDFDARRDVANFFGFILKRQPTVDYLLMKVPEVFTILLGSAGDVEIHRTICQILRECARYEALVSYILNLQTFWLFFQYIDDKEFEVATDNFSTFQDFFRNYPELTTQFLLRNADYFTECINGLIRSENYVAKRQSLRLLFQLIKQQRNHQYLMAYSRSLENLKLIMRLLKDKSKNIHYEAFQIFKVFIANPHKPKPIVDVLSRNKLKLLDMMDKTHNLADRREDQLYQKEREYIRSKILALPDPPQRQVAGATAAVSTDAAHDPSHHHRQEKHHQQKHLQKENSNETRPDEPVLEYPPRNRSRPTSPSRVQVPPGLLNAHPASPVLSHGSFPPNP